MIRTVTDENGTTTFAFDGGVWWGQLGRFMGFRDAVVTRENGGVTHARYGTSPWSAGREVYRSDFRADGTIEFFRYASVRDPDTGASTLDLDAPFFNPVRARCEAWLGWGGFDANQTIAEDQLVADCECAFAAPTQQPPPDSPPPPPEEGGPPIGPPPEGQLPPQGPPLPPQGGPGPSTCDPMGAGTLFAVYGWGTPFDDFGEDTDGEYYGVWTIDGAPAWTPTGGEPVDPTDWRPDFDALGRDNYPATITALPADLFEPGDSPPVRVAGGETVVRMTAVGWRYDPTTHRVTDEQDRGQTNLPNDERNTHYDWAAWDSGAAGARLNWRETQANGPFPSSQRSTFAYGAGFAEVTRVDESATSWAFAGTHSRSTERSWEQGEVVEQTDPDGVVTSLSRNACGQVTERENALQSPESWDYDGACHKLGWSWLSGEESWTYDDYGRVETHTLDPGGPSATQVERWSRSGNLASVEEGNGSDGTLGLKSTVVDEWGRTQEQTACASDGAGTPGCVAGTASRVERGWAADGSLRFVTAPFDPDASSPDTLTASWSYRDEFGRTEAEWTPAPVATQDYVLTETEWFVGEVTVTDPMGVDCGTAWDALSSTTACGGFDRGGLTRDAFGRVVRERRADNVELTTGEDGFGNPAFRRVERNLNFVDGATTPEWRWEWSEGGRLLSSSDSSGVSRSFTYDAIGRPRTASVNGPTLGTVQTAEWTYLELTSSGETVQLTTSADLDGSLTWTLSDATGRPFSTTLADGSTAWTARNSRGLPSTSTDVDGVETTYAWDGIGRASAETLTTLGASRSFAYDAAGRPTTTTDRDGVGTDTTWARSGHPLTTTRPLAAGGAWDLWSAVYDDAGRAVETTTAGVTVGQIWDDLGRLAVRCENPFSASTLGCDRRTTWGYDPLDRPIMETLADASTALSRHWQYDELGDLLAEQHADGTMESWEYYRSGLVGRHTDEEGLPTTWNYDDLGRVTTEDRPRMAASHTTYTNGIYAGSFGQYGARVEWEAPDGGTWTTDTDFAGRPTRKEDPFGDETAWTWVGSQLREVATTAPTGAVTSHSTWNYDAAGRVAVRWGPVDDSTYGAMGSGTPDPTAGDQAFAYGYSPEGRLLSREGPNDRTEWAWEDGVVTVEDVAGVSSTVFDYDPGTGRLAGRSIGDGTSAARDTIYGWDDLGRLASAVVDDGSETVATGYADRDLYGRPRSIGRYVNGSLETGESLTTDARGRITHTLQQTPTRTVQLEWGFYDDGALASVSADWGGGTFEKLLYERSGPENELTRIAQFSTGATLASFSGRDGYGRAQQVDLAGGAQIRQAFDLRGRLDWREGRTPTGDSRRKTYAWDARGRVEGILTETPTTYWAQQYTWAEPGWMLSETRTSASGVLTSEFSYDAAGNRLTREVDDGTTVETHAFAYDFGNVLVSVDGAPVSWNAFGETATDHRGTDIDRAGDGAEIGLASPTGTPLYAFTRGARGELVEVEDASGGLRTMAWGPAESAFPVAVLDDSGLDQLYVSAEGLPLGRLDGGVFRAMAVDGVGSVFLDGTDFLDDAGPFGESAPTAPSAERRTWAMLEQLPGTAYAAPRRRLYDSETGRFASQDPIGLAGGDHRFAYVGNNPTAGADPSGLFMEPPTTGGGTDGTGGRTITIGEHPRWTNRCWGVNCRLGTTMGTDGPDEDDPSDDDNTPEETEDAKGETDPADELFDGGADDSTWFTDAKNEGVWNRIFGEGGDDDLDEEPAEEAPRSGTKRDGTEGGRRARSVWGARMDTALEELGTDLDTSMFGGGPLSSSLPGAERGGRNLGGRGGSGEGVDAPLVLALPAATVTAEGVVIGSVVVPPMVVAVGAGLVVAEVGCRADAGCAAGQDATLQRYGSAARRTAEEMWASASSTARAIVQAMSGGGADTKPEEQVAVPPEVAAAAPTTGVLPANPDDLLDQGYVETSHPDAKAAGHRTFENPTTGDKVRFDKGKPGAPGHEGRDHYHRSNPNTTGRGDAYLDAEGNPTRKGSDDSHLYPGE